MRKLLDNIDQGKSSNIPNILHSVLMTNYAWRNITETTIKNYFIKTGFLENVTSSGIVEVNSIKRAIEEEELNPEQWRLMQKACNTDITFKEFLNAGNELEMHDIMTDKQIVSSINADVSVDEIEDLQDIPEP